jgi:predicted Zn-dependent peptidase
VTVADVRDAAQQIFRADRMSVVAVGMLKRSEESKMEKVVQGFGR